MKNEENVLSVGVIHLAVSRLQHIVSEHCSENRTSGSKDVGVAWKGAPTHY